MRKKAFTLIEIMIGLGVLALLMVTVTNIFFGGSRAYRKEIKNFNILDRGRFLFIKIRDDVRNANQILEPSDNGEKSQRLTIIKHKIDFNEMPENTYEYEDAPIYFENIKIEYFLEGFEEEEEEEKKKYKDTKKIVRVVSKQNGDIYEEIDRKIMSYNVSELVFLRKNLKTQNQADLLVPEKAGMSSNNLKVEVLFKSYRLEDYLVTDPAEVKKLDQFFSIRFSTYINVRGGFLGGEI